MKGPSTVRLLLLGASALLLELTLLSDVSWRGARPDLLIPIVCFAGLFVREPGTARRVAWGLGLIRDLGTAGPLGLYAFIYLGIAWSITLLRQVLFRDHPFTQVAVAGTASVAACLLTAIYASIFSGGIPARAWFWQTILSAFLTAIVAPILLTALAHDRSQVA